jgi:hypothetical protein
VLYSQVSGSDFFNESPNCFDSPGFFLPIYGIAFSRDTVVAFGIGIKTGLA